MSDSLGKVCTVYPYTAQHAEELSFEQSIILDIIDKPDNIWWVARKSTGESGLVPCNYIDEIISLKELKSQQIYSNDNELSKYADPSQLFFNKKSICNVFTRYPYKAQNHDELTFEKNMFLEILDKPIDYPDWWKARDSEGKIGLVPSNYVEEIALMNSSYEDESEDEYSFDNFYGELQKTDEVNSNQQETRKIQQSKENEINQQSVRQLQVQEQQPQSHDQDENPPQELTIKHENRVTQYPQKEDGNQIQPQEKKELQDQNEKQLKNQKEKQQPQIQINKKKQPEEQKQQMQIQDEMKKIGQPQEQQEDQKKSDKQLQAQDKNENQPQEQGIKHENKVNQHPRNEDDSQIQEQGKKELQDQNEKQSKDRIEQQPQIQNNKKKQPGGQQIEIQDEKEKIGQRQELQEANDQHQQNEKQELKDKNKELKPQNETVQTNTSRELQQQKFQVEDLNEEQLKPSESSSTLQQKHTNLESKEKQQYAKSTQNIATEEKPVLEISMLEDPKDKELLREENREKIKEEDKKISRQQTAEVPVTQNINPGNQNNIKENSNNSNCEKGNEKVKDEQTQKLSPKQNVEAAQQKDNENIPKIDQVDNILDKPLKEDQELKNSTSENKERDTNNNLYPTSTGQNKHNKVTDKGIGETNEKYSLININQQQQSPIPDIQNQVMQEVEQLEQQIHQGNQHKGKNQQQQQEKTKTNGVDQLPNKHKEDQHQLLELYRLENQQQLLKQHKEENQHQKAESPQQKEKENVRDVNNDLRDESQLQQIPLIHQSTGSSKPENGYPHAQVQGPIVRSITITATRRKNEVNKKKKEDQRHHQEIISQSANSRSNVTDNSISEKVINATENEYPSENKEQFLDNEMSKEKRENTAVDQTFTDNDLPKSTAPISQVTSISKNEDKIKSTKVNLSSESSAIQNTEKNVSKDITKAIRNHHQKMSKPHDCDDTKNSYTDKNQEITRRSTIAVTNVNEGLEHRESSYNFINSDQQLLGDSTFGLKQSSLRPTSDKKENLNNSSPHEKTAYNVNTTSQSLNRRSSDEPQATNHKSENLHQDRLLFSNEIVFQEKQQHFVPTLNTSHSNTGSTASSSRQPNQQSTNVNNDATYLESHTKPLCKQNIQEIQHGQSVISSGQNCYQHQSYKNVKGNEIHYSSKLGEENGNSPYHQNLSRYSSSKSVTDVTNPYQNKISSNHSYKSENEVHQKEKPHFSREHSNSHRAAPPVPPIDYHLPRGENKKSKGYVNELFMNEEWYHGAITRSQCEMLFQQTGSVGDYLVRDSESTPGDLSLSLKATDSMKHYKIIRKKNKYVMGQRVFRTMDELIRTYQPGKVSIYTDSYGRHVFLERPAKRQYLQNNGNYYYS